MAKTSRFSLNTEISFLFKQFGVDFKLDYNSTQDKLYLDLCTDRGECIQSFNDHLKDFDPLKTNLYIHNQLLTEVRNKISWTQHHSLIYTRNVHRWIVDYVNDNSKSDLQRTVFVCALIFLKIMIRPTEPTIVGYINKNTTPVFIKNTIRQILDKSITQIDTISAALFFNFVEDRFPTWLINSGKGYRMLQNDLAICFIRSKQIVVTSGFASLLIHLSTMEIDDNKVMNEEFHNMVNQINRHNHMLAEDKYNQFSDELIKIENTKKPKIIISSALHDRLCLQTNILELEPTRDAYDNVIFSELQMNTLQSFIDSTINYSRKDLTKLCVSMLTSFGVSSAATTYEKSTGRITTVLPETKFISLLGMIYETKSTTISTAESLKSFSLIKSVEHKIGRIKENQLSDKLQDIKGQIHNLVALCIQEIDQEETEMMEILNNFSVSLTTLTGESVTDYWTLCTTIKGYIGEHFISRNLGVYWFSDYEKPTLEQKFEEMELDAGDIFKYIHEFKTLKPDNIIIKTDNEKIGLKKISHIEIQEYGWVSDPVTKRKRDERKWKKVKSAFEHENIPITVSCFLIVNAKSSWEDLLPAGEEIPRSYEVVRKGLPRIFGMLTEYDNDLSSHYIEGIKTANLRDTGYEAERHSVISNNDVKKYKEFFKNIIEKELDISSELAHDYVFWEKSYNILNQQTQIVPDEWLENLVTKILDYSRDNSMQPCGRSSARELLASIRKQEEDILKNSNFDAPIDCICQIPLIKNNNNDKEKKELMNVERVLHQILPESTRLNICIPITTGVKQDVAIKNKEWLACKKALGVCEAYFLKLDYIIGKNGKITKIKREKDLRSTLITCLKNTSAVPEKIRTILKNKKDDDIEITEEKVLEGIVTILNEKISEGPKIEYENIREPGDLENTIKKSEQISNIIDKTIEIIDPLWNKETEERFSTLESRQNDRQSKLNTKGNIMPHNTLSEDIVNTFMETLQQECEPLGINQLPQSLISNDLVKYLSNKLPMAYVLSFQYLLSFITESSKYKGFRYAILAHEIGRAVNEILSTNVPQGKFYVKYLEFSRLNLFINVPAAFKSQSVMTTCCLAMPGVTFDRTAVKLDTTPDYSHRFYVNHRLSKQYEGSLGMTLSYGMLIHQYEVLHSDLEKTKELMRQTWSWILTLSLTNNRSMNEWCQSYRYVAMSFLGDFIYPKELAKKLTTAQRTTVYKMIVRKYKLTIPKWGRWREENADNIRIAQEPNTTIDFKYPSVFFGFEFTSMKSLVTEIYIEHNFNKQIDPKDRSMEKVFDKLFEKHIEFKEGIKEHGSDYFLMGDVECFEQNAFEDHCLYIIENYQSGMLSGLIKHDAGVLLGEFMTSNTGKRPKARLNVGISFLTNTSSIVKDPIHKIDFRTCQEAVRKKRILRQITNCVKQKNKFTKKEIGQIMSQITRLNGELSNSESTLAETALLNRTRDEVKEIKWSELCKDDRFTQLKLDNKKKCGMILLMKKIGKIRHVRNDESSRLEKLISDLQQSASFNSRQTVITNMLKNGDFRSVLISRINEVHEFEPVMQTVDEWKEKVESFLIEKVDLYLRLRDTRLESPHLNIDQQMNEVCNDISDCIRNYNFDEIILLILSIIALSCPKHGKSTEEYDQSIRLDIKLIVTFFPVTERVLNIVCLFIQTEVICGLDFAETLSVVGGTITEQYIKSTGGQILVMNILALKLTSSLETNLMYLIESIQIMRDTSVSKQMRQRGVGTTWEIPYSLRTKVILALVNLALTSLGSGEDFRTSIQVLAEQWVVRPTQDFTGIATKEQLGSERELHIMTIEYKVILYMLSGLFKKFNRVINTEELTESLAHPEAKYYKIEDFSNRLMSTAQQNRLSISTEADYSRPISFCFSMNIDHSTWAPGTNSSSDYRVLLPGIAELLEDKYNYTELAILRASAKKNEIPRCIVEKFVSDTFEPERLDHFRKQAYDLVREGNASFTNVADCGQGLTHDLSSTQAMAVQLMMHKLTKIAAKQLSLDLKLSTIQGSDDEDTLVEMRSINPAREINNSDDLLDEACLIASFYNHAKRLLNFKTSPKSTYGRCIEFNSNFILNKANTMPVYKFVSSQLLPQKVFDLHDAISGCFSNCQQAFYSGSPYPNILLVWLINLTRSRYLSHLIDIPVTDESGEKRYYENTKPDELLFPWSLEKPFYIEESRTVIGRNRLIEDTESLPYDLGGIFLPTISCFVADNLTHIELENVVTHIDKYPEHKGLYHYTKSLETESQLLGRTTRYKSDTIFSVKKVLPKTDDIKEMLRKTKILKEQMKDRINLGTNIAVNTVITYLLSKTQAVDTQTDYIKLLDVLESDKIEYSLANTDEVKVESYFRGLMNAKFHIGEKREADEFGIKNISFKEKADEMLNDDTDVVMEMAKCKSVLRAVQSAREEMRQSIIELESQIPESVLAHKTEVFGRSSLDCSNIKHKLSSEPVYVLLHKFNNNLNYGIFPRNFDWNNLSSDMALLEHLCAEEFKIINHNINTNTSDEKTLKKNLDIILAIGELYRLRPIKIFAPCARNSDSNNLMSSIFRTNIVSGLKQNLIFTDIKPLPDLNSLTVMHVVELLALVQKLISEKTKNQLISILYTTNLKQYINVDTTIREFLVEKTKTNSSYGISSKNRILHLRAIFGDPDAITMIENKIKRVSAEHTTYSSSGLKYFKTVYKGVVCISVRFGNSILHRASSFRNKEILQQHLMFISRKLDRLSTSIYTFNPGLFECPVNKEAFGNHTDLYKYFDNLRDHVMYFSTDTMLDIVWNEEKKNAGFFVEDRSIFATSTIVKPVGDKLSLTIQTTDTDSYINYVVELQSDFYKEQYVANLQMRAIGLRTFGEKTSYDLSEEMERVSKIEKSIRNKQSWTTNFSRLSWNRKISRTSFCLFQKILQTFAISVVPEKLIPKSESKSKVLQRQISETTSLTSVDVAEQRLEEKVRTMYNICMDEKDTVQQQSLFSALKNIFETHIETLESSDLNEMYQQVSQYTTVDIFQLIEVPPISPEIDSKKLWRLFFMEGGVRATTLKKFSMNNLIFHYKYPFMSYWYYQVFSKFYECDDPNFSFVYLNLVKLTNLLVSQVKDYKKRKSDPAFVKKLTSVNSSTDNSSGTDDEVNVEQVIEDEFLDIENDVESDDDSTDEESEVSENEIAEEPIHQDKLSELISNRDELSETTDFKFSDSDLLEHVSTDDVVDNVTTCLKLLILAEIPAAFLDDNSTAQEFIGTRYIRSAMIFFNSIEEELSFSVNIDRSVKNDNDLTPELLNLSRRKIIDISYKARKTGQNKKIKRISVEGSFNMSDARDLLLFLGKCI